MPAEATLGHPVPSPAGNSAWWRRLGRCVRRLTAQRPGDFRGFRGRGSFRGWVGEAVRFAGVGASGLVVALGALNAVMAVGRAFVLANAVAFVLAGSWNFGLNRWLTFPATDRPWTRQWLEFLGGSLAAAGLNWAVAGALYARGGFFYDHYNAAALTGTVVAAGANFLWAKGRVFRASDGHAPGVSYG